MRSLIFIILLFVIIPTNLLKAQDYQYLQDTNKPLEPIKPTEYTRIAGFHIQQDIKEAVDICEKVLQYKFYLNSVLDPTHLAFSCEPDEEFDTAQYNLITRGKPNSIMFLTSNEKVIGLHVLFLKRLVYEKTLVSFINSDIIEGKMLNLTKLGNVKSYINHGENWLGWYTKNNIKVKEANKLVNKTTYLIHLEMLFEPQKE